MDYQEWEEGLYCQGRNDRDQQAGAGISCSCVCQDGHGSPAACSACFSRASGHESRFSSSAYRQATIDCGRDDDQVRGQLSVCCLGLSPPLWPLLTAVLQATAVAATLGNPVSTSAVQGMVQGAVNVAATATVAAVPAGTTAATLPVTTAAALPAATTAAAVAAVPVLPAAVPAVTAVAPAQAVGVQVVAEAHGHTKTLSPATPLWAQAMGAHLPAAVALPSTPFPPAMVSFTARIGSRCGSMHVAARMWQSGCGSMYVAA